MDCFVLLRLRLAALAMTDAKAKLRRPCSLAGAGAPVFQTAFLPSLYAGAYRADPTCATQGRAERRALSLPAASCSDEIELHEIAVTTERPGYPGVPRAVFEACSATTPEERRPGTGGQLVILRW